MRIYKDMTNLEIKDLLEAVAAAYKIKNEEKNRFRIIAYERAAASIEHLSSEAKDLWDEGKLEEVAGIGESIANHLDELFKTGKSKHFESVMKGLPSSMFELMKIPGIGAKTALKLATTLKITKDEDAIKKLEEAVKAGKVAKVEGMGVQSQDAIEKSIKEIKGRKIRLLLPYASQIATDIVIWMEKSTFIVSCDPLGSVRRRVSTIGDIDIACSSNSLKNALQHFTVYPKAKRVLEQGDHTASIILPGDIQVDMMVQEPDSYGSLLQHFTGSKHHNIALREYALKKGLSLSEYGIRKLKNQKSKIKNTTQNSKLIRFKTEGELYKYLGLEYIPPELREDAGEIEAALRKAQGEQPGLPKLVELEDIKGDLQIHSNFDIETSHDLGESSMDEIIKKAQSMGYQYLALTEHNPSQRGHKESDIIDILKHKKEVVEHINYSFVKGMNNRVIKVFNSLEIDILPDGRLPVPDKGLELLDFALVSIHSSFAQSKEVATARVLQALSHPKVKIFSHPTGRILNKREGVELDWIKIFEFCKTNKKWLEINADPARLDIPDYLVREAINKGIGLTLGTDAHHVDSMDNMEYGVSVAQRGWAEKKDIINTLSLEEFEKVIE